MGSPEEIILREMLAAESGWVSGADLASKMGVSRVAVWHHMEKLRAKGFEFEAKRARGYRLASRPDALHEALVGLQLKTRPRGFAITVFDEIDSTNDEAARQLAAGAATPFAIFAKRQTRGRGRFGRAWHSVSTGNLYVSFAFRPRVPPERMQTFTLWMGVNVCELIANFARITPGLKWPNDIVFDGRKAGGMLTEARVDADQIRDLVFGLGLNVNSPSADWPGELARRAVCLCELTGSALDLNRLAAALVGRVILAYEAFVEGEHGKSFADLWNRFDVLRERRATVIEGGQRHSGTVLGIDDEGALLLRDDHGRTQRFRAGEVTLEK